jgi:hypothetical protein
MELDDTATMSASPLNIQTALQAEVPTGAAWSNRPPALRIDGQRMRRPERLPYRPGTLQPRRAWHAGRLREVLQSYKRAKDEEAERAERAKEAEQAAQRAGETDQRTENVKKSSSLKRKASAESDLSGKWLSASEFLANVLLLLQLQSSLVHHAARVVAVTTRPRPPAPMTTRQRILPVLLHLLHNPASGLRVDVSASVQKSSRTRMFSRKLLRRRRAFGTAMWKTLRMKMTSG